MAELTADDVEQYTRGRLKASDDETDRLLSGALAAARRACGWHVSPVIEETLELDGEGGNVLSLPTLRIVTLTSVTELGRSYNVATELDVSKRKGNIMKRGGGCWSNRYGAIEVTLEHGFTEEEAQDWRTAVLEATNRLAVDVFRKDPNVTRKRVDDVDIYWSDRVVGEFENDPALGRFRILPGP